MALTRCEAVVVRTYPLGDTSRIAVLYSPPPTAPASSYA